MFGTPTRLKRYKFGTAPLLFLQFFGIAFIAIGLLFIINNVGQLIFLLPFPIVGVVIVIIARILFSRFSKQSDEIIKNLMDTSEKLHGVLVRVKRVGGPGLNNNYIIIVSATNKRGIVQEYTSDPVSSYADLAVIDFRKNPIPVDIYVNPIDPQRYYVDISSIPDLVPLSRDAFIQLAKR